MSNSSKIVEYKRINSDSDHNEVLAAPMKLPTMTETYEVYNPIGQRKNIVKSWNEPKNGHIVHYLPPFNVYGKYYTQVVKEITSPNCLTVNLEVITLNDKGVEISKLFIDRSKSGNIYTNNLKKIGPSYFWLCHAGMAVVCPCYYV